MIKEDLSVQDRVSLWLDLAKVWSPIMRIRCIDEGDDGVVA